MPYNLCICCIYRNLLDYFVVAMHDIGVIIAKSWLECPFMKHPER